MAQTERSRIDPADTSLIPGGDFRAEGRSYYAGVQCLRFAAAFVVVARHATFYTNERLWPDMPIWYAGGAGVDIFFIISGFVMMITSGKFERKSGGWRDFALRRLARIVPLYWLATTIKLVALLAVPAVVLHARLDWIYVLKSYLFIPAYGADGAITPLLAVGWTLLYEMFFYLLFTLALALRANLLLFCGTVLLLCAAGSLFRPEHGAAWLIYLDPLVLEFLLGMAIAKWGTRPQIPLAWCIVLPVAGVAAILAIPGPAFDKAGLLRAIGPALIVLGVVGLERHVRRFPRALVFLGAASYSLYLMHPLIAPLGPAILRRTGLLSPTLSVIACIGLALGAAVATFLCFERPVTNLLGGMIRGRDARAPGAPAGARLSSRT